MGHRALIAYQTGADTYSVHYSHWGAHNLELEGDISFDTPAGSKNMEPAFFTALTSSLDAGVNDDAPDIEDLNVPEEMQPAMSIFATLAAASGATDMSGYAAKATEDTPVSKDPVRTNVTFAEAVSVVDDFGDIEAFYHVSPDFEVTGFWVHYVRLGQDDTRSFLGRPRWHAGEPVSLAYDTGWLAGTEQMLRSLATDGTLADGTDAFATLRRQVVDRYERTSGSTYILSHSSALRDADGSFMSVTAADTKAFVPTGSSTRRHPFGDYMLVGSYGKSLRDWMVAPDLRLPAPYNSDTPEIPGVSFESPWAFPEQAEPAAQ